jgi:hypothetical protein
VRNLARIILGENCERNFGKFEKRMSSDEKSKQAKVEEKNKHKICCAEFDNLR